MHPLNPVLSAAVIDDITSNLRHDAAARAGETPRRSRLGGLRGRLAARRGAPPAPSTAPRMTVRAGRA
jgi:hypothetical protein